jgi:hypothetical protein
MQGLGGALDVAIHLTHELHDIVESNRNPILSTHSDQQTPATRPAVFGVRACFAERRPGREPAAKRPSKQDAVISMLQRPEGATVEEVASAMGWQRHTVRGLFSGTLKKKLRLTLASATEERGRVYRIAAPEQA